MFKRVIPNPKHVDHCQRVHAWSLVAKRHGVPVDLRRWIAQTYLWDADVYPTKLVPVNGMDNILASMDTDAADKLTTVFNFIISVFFVIFIVIVPNLIPNHKSLVLPTAIVLLLIYLLIQNALLPRLSPVYRRFRKITNITDALCKNSRTRRELVYHCESEQWEEDNYLEHEGFKCIFNAVLPSVFTVLFPSWCQVMKERHYFPETRSITIQERHDLLFCAICTKSLESSICVAGVRILLYKKKAIYTSLITSVGLCTRCAPDEDERTALDCMGAFRKFSDCLTDAALRVENEACPNTISGPEFLSRLLQIYHRNMWEANMCRCVPLKRECTCFFRTFSLFPESDVIVLKE